MANNEVDNVTNLDVYPMDTPTTEMGTMINQRMDGTYGGYVNLPNVGQLPTANANFTLPTFGNAQTLQPLYPRMQIQSENQEEQPVYVNAKQYNRIMLRRKARAKWESEHHITKKETPYMHRSRHEHAVRRIRGSDGRFLKKEDAERILQEGKRQMMNTNDPSPTIPTNPLLPNSSMASTSTNDPSLVSVAVSSISSLDTSVIVNPPSLNSASTIPLSTSMPSPSVLSVAPSIIVAANATTTSSLSAASPSIIASTSAAVASTTTTTNANANTNANTNTNTGSNANANSSASASFMTTPLSYASAVLPLADPTAVGNTSNELSRMADYF